MKVNAFCRKEVLIKPVTSPLTGRLNPGDKRGKYEKRATNNCHRFVPNHSSNCITN